ncbi:MAG: hypothetical protein FJ291_05865 [Planctomycetes bacterium]|nr:hypothetical protein [Planctomycetota bacterium]
MPNYEATPEWRIGYSSSVYEQDGTLYVVRHNWSKDDALWPPIDSSLIKSFEVGPMLENGLDPPVVRGSDSLGQGARLADPVGVVGRRRAVEHGRDLAAMMGEEVEVVEAEAVHACLEARTALSFRIGRQTKSTAPSSGGPMALWHLKRLAARWQYGGLRP